MMKEKFDAQSQNMLGIECYEKRSFTEAHKHFKCAAEQGLKIAYVNFGWMCLKGLGKNKDIKTAYEYFKKGAAKGIHVAYYQLGRMEHHGIGEENGRPDPHKAMAWYRKAQKVLYGVDRDIEKLTQDFPEHFNQE